MKFVFQISLFFVATCVLGATTNVVRTVEPWPQGIISAKANWTEVIEAVKRGFGEGSNDLNHCTIIAWSAKVDHLDCPPRLFEEALVTIRCPAPGRTNAWALGYVGRMPSGGALARSWSLFDYPHPLVDFATFPSEPSDKEIASFLRATNFGYNEFYPDRIVLDVVLFRRSELVESALKIPVPQSEKRARHSAYLKSIPY